MSQKDRCPCSRPCPYSGYDQVSLAPGPETFLEVSSVGTCVSTLVCPDSEDTSGVQPFLSRTNAHLRRVFLSILSLSLSSTNTVTNSSPLRPGCLSRLGRVKAPNCLIAKGMRQTQPTTFKVNTHFVIYRFQL